MSSSPPPYNPAGSPPPGLNASLSNPRKRLSLSTSNLSSVGPSSSGNPPNKRRKPSASSSSAHPLRQTSFPPPESSPNGSRSASASRYASYSPAVGEEGASVSSFGAGRAKKGGRGKRNTKSGTQSIAGTSALDDEDEDAPGHAGGGRGGGRGKRRGKAAAKAAEEDEAEDEDEDDGAQGEALFDGAREMDDAAKAQEGEHRMILYEALSRDQRERYDIWNRQSLRRQTVRKLVNQTLSQSVPQSIVLAVSASAKVFIGDLVEKARDVQAEWVACEPSWPNGDKKNSSPVKAEADTEADAQTDGAKSVLPPNFDVQEMHRGPLTPDHLREALRRYRRDREGGSAGLHGMSLHGKEAVASRTGGRRLFR